MKIQSLIITTLATACVCGKSEPSSFDDTRNLDFEEFKLVVNLHPFTEDGSSDEHWLPSQEVLESKEFCETACTTNTRGYFSEIDSCTLTIDDAALQAEIDRRSNPEDGQDSGNVTDTGVVDQENVTVAEVSCSGIWSRECVGGRRPLHTIHYDPSPATSLARSTTWPR